MHVILVDSGLGMVSRWTGLFGTVCLALTLLLLRQQPSPFHDTAWVVQPTTDGPRIDGYADDAKVANYDTTDPIHADSSTTIPVKSVKGGIVPLKVRSLLSKGWKHRKVRDCPGGHGCPPKDFAHTAHLCCADARCEEAAAGGGEGTTKQISIGHGGVGT